jgi:hypothetical protein
VDWPAVYALENRGLLKYIEGFPTTRMELTPSAAEGRDLPRTLIGASNGPARSPDSARARRFEANRARAERPRQMITEFEKAMAEKLHGYDAELARLREVNTDLLTALKDYRRLHDQLAPRFGCTCGTCKPAREAIFKAEGGQP